MTGSRPTCSLQCRSSKLSRHRNGAGFTYLALLFMIAIASITLAATGMVWSLEQRREKEAALLVVGHEFQAAIASYYEGSPGLVKRYPDVLADLLDDNRFLGIKRHLRQIYPDPLSGSLQWGLVTAPEGGIMGVYSQAEGTPLKQANFAERDAAFAGKQRYADWVFVYRPVSLVKK